MPPGRGWAKPADRGLEPPPGRILDAKFFARDTREVARDLLDKLLVREVDGRRLWGRLVEVEAYLGPEDLAAHSKGGRRTARTEVMFGPTGHAYVYFIYGFHYMLNIVTEGKDFPAAVLIRAVEPLRGIALMKKRRGTDEPRSLASGPGKLCEAFAIDRTLNGSDICGKVLYLQDAGEPAPKIITTPRIGVDYAAEWKNKPFRFLIGGNTFVSKP